MKPELEDARDALVIMGCTLIFCIAGCALLFVVVKFLEAVF